jgi:hypothetical protein
MGEPLRHRQTKEAATDMFSLQPPRHISILPKITVPRAAIDGELAPQADVAARRAVPGKVSILRQRIAPGSLSEAAPGVLSVLSSADVTFDANIKNARQTGLGIRLPRGIARERAKWQHRFDAPIF